MLRGCGAPFAGQSVGAESMRVPAAPHQGPPSSTSSQQSGSSSSNRTWRKWLSGIWPGTCRLPVVAPHQLQGGRASTSVHSPPTSFAPPPSLGCARTHAGTCASGSVQVSIPPVPVGASACVLVAPSVHQSRSLNKTAGWHKGGGRVDWPAVAAVAASRRRHTHRVCGRVDSRGCGQVRMRRGVRVWLRVGLGGAAASSPCVHLMSASPCVALPTGLPRVRTGAVWCDVPAARRAACVSKRPTRGRSAAGLVGGCARTGPPMVPLVVCRRLLDLVSHPSLATIRCPPGPSHPPSHWQQTSTSAQSRQAAKLVCNSDALTRAALAGAGPCWHCISTAARHVVCDPELPYGPFAPMALSVTATSATPHSSPSCSNSTCLSLQVGPALAATLVHKY